MKCLKCGTEFEGKFCPKCATPVVSQPENAAPNDEQFKICPICRQPYKGKFCPRGCISANGTAAKKKRLTGKQIILIVVGILLLGAFAGIFTALTSDPTGYDKLDGQPYEDQVENALKNLGVEKIIEVTGATIKDGEPYDLKITTDKAGLLLALDDNNNVTKVIDDKSGVIYVAGISDKDSKGRLLKDVYAYTTGQIQQPADQQAIKEKEEAEKKAAEAKKAEEERRKKEEAEQEKHTVSTSQQIQLKVWVEETVEAQLKAPKTAKFAPLKDWGYSRDENHFQVTGYVDAQNSFGAMIRSNFVVDIQWDGKSDTATITNVSID